MLATALNSQGSLANAFTIDHCEIAWKRELRVTEHITEDGSWFLWSHGNEPKKHYPSESGKAVPECQGAEILVEGDQDAPFRAGAGKHFPIFSTGHRLRCGKNIMAVQPEGLNTGKRDVLVGQKPH